MTNNPLFSNAFDISETTTNETIINFKFIDGREELIVSKLVLNNTTAGQLANKLHTILAPKLSDKTKSSTSTNTNTKTKILVVEDNTGYRNELLEFLNKNNFDTFSAVNGDDAVKMTTQFHPDIILMDHIMPVLNGLDAARVIKQTPSYKNTKIYLLIGYGKITDFSKDFDNIIYKVIQKPIDYEELIKELPSS